jgi:hypothetical protein
MDRREFIKVSGAGMLTLFLSGCGLSMLNGEGKKAAGAPQLPRPVKLKEVRV